jgi:hypothetical protein
VKAIGIKALQTNPALLTRSLEQEPYTLITKHGQPIGIAAAFDDCTLDKGFRHYLMLQAFRNGDLSLGELSRSLGKTKAETIQFLGDLCIPIADYPLTEDIATLEGLGL